MLQGIVKLPITALVTEDAWASGSTAQSTVPTSPSAFHSCQLTPSTMTS